MTTRTLIKETLALLLLASLVFAPGVFVSAQTQTPPNPLADLPNAIKATPGCLGIELATTASGKQVIFAWFENKKAVLAWYYSQTHQALMKMSPGPPKPRGPLADVPDDGRPILAVASVTMTRPQDDIPSSGFPPVSHISIELYAPLPGGLAVGGRFAPAGVSVPGLRYTPSATPPGAN
jgi:hypothetical protein